METCTVYYIAPRLLNIWMNLDMFLMKLNYLWMILEVHNNGPKVVLAVFTENWINHVKSDFDELVYNKIRAGTSTLRRFIREMRAVQSKILWK